MGSSGTLGEQDILGIKPPIHFIGVCGTAMASVAIDLADRGWDVSGSDSQFYPPMSTLLDASRVRIFRQFGPENLAGAHTIVVGNAISRGNIELEASLNLNLPLISLPELIRFTYMPGKRSIVVTGTHGKTTTSSMIAHLYRTLDLDPGWMIGGNPLDLPSPCHQGDGDYFVIEGDEYDTAWFDKRPKFFHYRPYHAIISSIEFDHSDIYPDIEAIESAFRRFAGLLSEEGTLVVRSDDPRAVKAAEAARCRVVTFGLADDSHWRLTNPTVGDDFRWSAFITGPENTRLTLSLCTPGIHNLLNGLSALALAVETGLEPKLVADALGSFRGVERRLQLRAQKGGITVYDDFAHHPTAIRSTLVTLRRMHPGSRLWAVFEPRSNTMVRNYLQEELESALAWADEVILGPLYRQDKIPVHQRLDVAGLQKRLLEKGIETTLLDTLDGAGGRVAGMLATGDVVVVMTNGSFGGLTAELQRSINNSNSKVIIG